MTHPCAASSPDGITDTLNQAWAPVFNRAPTCPRTVAEVSRGATPCAGMSKGSPLQLPRLPWLRLARPSSPLRGRTVRIWDEVWGIGALTASCDPPEVMRELEAGAEPLPGAQRHAGVSPHGDDEGDSEELSWRREVYPAVVPHELGFEARGVGCKSGSCSPCDGGCPPCPLWVLGGTAIAPERCASGRRPVFTFFEFEAAFPILDRGLLQLGRYGRGSDPAVHAKCLRCEGCPLSGWCHGDGPSRRGRCR